MTEFALIAPVFILLVVGLLSFGRIFFYWISVNHTANETARWAVVDRNPYAPRTLQQHAIDEVGTAEFSANDPRVCISFPDGSQAVGNRVQVKVQKPFYILPFLGIGNITIRGSSTMRIERLNSTPTYGSAGDVNPPCS